MRHSFYRPSLGNRQPGLLTSKMHLPEESANESVWSALSWEKRDVRSDDLPMMNSFLWPIGKWMGVNEQFPNSICIYIYRLWTDSILPEI